MSNKRSKLAKELQELLEQTENETDKEQLNKLKSKLKKEATICGAMQGNGKICVRAPYIREDGSTVNRCRVHGGKQTGQKTEEGRKRSLANLNPKARLVTGIYSKDFKDMLTQEEVDFYNKTMDWFFEEYEEFTDPVNLSMLDRYILNFIKQARKDSKNFLNESPSYNDFEVKMIRFAESLGLNRKFKESKENKDNVSQVGIAGLFMDNDNE